MDKELLFEIVKMVISLLATGLLFYVTKVLLPQIKLHMAQKREQIGAEKFDKIVKFSKAAVDAAEQMFKESGMGEKKKELAIGVISGLADKIGCDISTEEINVLIESAVKVMNDAKNNVEKLN